MYILPEIPDQGETIRLDCDACGGVQTLSVTHNSDGTVLYNCFRANCNLRGAVVDKGALVPTEPARAPEKKVWMGPHMPIPSEVDRWIRDEWGIVSPRSWHYTSEYGGRIVMPVLDPAGHRRGWVLRNDGSWSPKALTFMEPEEVSLSWYKTHSNAPTVVVEDIPSAIRASTHVNAVALIGTACGYHKAHEIAEHAPRTVYVALDQDATALAIKLAARYSLLWESPQVLPLTKDIKNMTEQEARDLLENLNG